MFSSSGSSSGAPLARVQTETSLSSGRRRPRPRSPPSMYVAYESNVAKAPKPLIKLDKKGKGKEKAPQQSSSPTNSLRPRANSALPSAVPSSSSAPPTLRQRPSLSSFFNVRRKNSLTVETEPVPSSARMPLPAREMTPPPLSYAVDLHETNVHPVDDIQMIPRRSDKAARMLGKLAIDPPDGNLVVSEFSGTFRIPPRSSSPDGELSSLGDGSSLYGDDDEWFVDDAHLHRDSRLISPIEFATRPPSGQLAPPPPQTLFTEDDDESTGPATPIAESPGLRRHVSDAPTFHARRASYASIHNHYSDDTSRQSKFVEFRPDTPYLDTLVAVNSQVVVSPRHIHARSQSVVRTETKEGWMGEWNQDDMKDVIHKLRSLK